MIDLEAIDYRHRNSHDVEDVALERFLRFFGGRIRSVLDVGCHNSRIHYASTVRRIMEHKQYDGIDVLADPATAQILDAYHVGELKVTKLGTYDCVISISAIEHSGITTYVAENHREERRAVIKAMLAHAGSFVFVTVPFGAEAIKAGHYAHVESGELSDWDAMALGLGFLPLTKDFYFNPFPQMNQKWRHIDRREASVLPMDPKVDVQCVAVCSWITSVRDEGTG